jgi:hypothetical protein
VPVAKYGGGKRFAQKKRLHRFVRRILIVTQFLDGPPGDPLAVRQPFC